MLVWWFIFARHLFQRFKARGDQLQCISYWLSKYEAVTVVYFDCSLRWFLQGLKFTTIQCSLTLPFNPNPKGFQKHECIVVLDEKDERVQLHLVFDGKVWMDKGVVERLAQDRYNWCYQNMIYLLLMTWKHLEVKLNADA